MTAHLNPGRNIALKVPPHQYESTIEFYRDVVGLEPVTPEKPGARFAFGGNVLWIDRVEGMSQAEIWLELVTGDVTKAAEDLEDAKVVRCDEIEPLPDGLDAFWISSPASIIHLVSKQGEP